MVWQGKYSHHLRNDDGAYSVPADERRTYNRIDAVLRSGYDSGTRTIFCVFRKNTVSKAQKRPLILHTEG